MPNRTVTARLAADVATWQADGLLDNGTAASLKKRWTQPDFNAPSFEVHEVHILYEVRIERHFAPFGGKLDSRTKTLDQCYGTLRRRRADRLRYRGGSGLHIFGR